MRSLFAYWHIMALTCLMAWTAPMEAQANNVDAPENRLQNSLSKETSLIAAIRAGDSTTVKHLLEQGTSPNVKNQNGTPALILAVQGGQVDIVALLVDAGTDKEAINGALREAAGAGQSGIVVYLSWHADVNAPDMEGRTALMLAAASGHVDVVRLLLHRGADVDVRDKADRSVLWWAGLSKNAEIMSLLLPATQTDLDIVDVLLNDVVKDKNIRWGDPASHYRIVLDKKGFENLRPSNKNVLVDDLSKIDIEFDKVEVLPEFGFSHFLEAFEKVFPHCKAFLTAERPIYGKDNTAVIKFLIGPGVHGDGRGDYQFVKRKGHWIIKKRSLWYTE